MPKKTQKAGNVLPEKLPDGHQLCPKCVRDLKQYGVRLFSCSLCLGKGLVSNELFDACLLVHGDDIARVSKYHLAILRDALKKFE